MEMGERPYDPSLGRFLAVDPIEGGALNNYDYAAQDPINVYDLDGQCICLGKRIKKGAKATGKFVWKHKVDIALTGAMFIPGAGQAVAAARAAQLAYKTIKTARVVHASLRHHTVVKIAYTSARTGGRKFVKLDRPDTRIPHWHWGRGRLSAKGTEHEVRHYRLWGRRT